MQRLFALFMIVAVMAAAPGAQAASLWVDNGPNANLFSDHKARMVGDIVTIIVLESTSAVNKASMGTDKSSSVSADAGTGIFDFLKGWSAGGKDKYSASGTTTRNNTLSTKITTQVIEVKPNGNLVISGTQVIKVNNEDQKVTVTGIIRPDDIAADNTILSTYVANAEIKVEGKGVIAKKQKPGLLTGLFDWLF